MNRELNVESVLKDYCVNHNLDFKKIVKMPRTEFDESVIWLDCNMEEIDSEDNLEKLFETRPEAIIEIKKISDVSFVAEREAIKKYIITH